MVSHDALSGYADSIRRIVRTCIVMGVGMILFASAVFAKGRILAVGNQCMQYSDGSWRLVAEGPIFPSSVHFASPSDIFLAVSKDSPPRAGVKIPAGCGWARWDPATDSIVPLPGTEKMKPRQIMPNKTAYYVEYRFHGDVLYEEKPGGKRTLLHSSRGMSSFEYAPDGSHVYSIVPAMGGKESPYFSDWVIGSKTTLYLTRSKGKPKSIVTGDCIRDARLVANGAYAVFWEAGPVDMQGKTKAWRLRTVRLSDGAVTTVADVVDNLMGSRGVPEEFWAFQGQPWIVHVASLKASKKGPREYVVYNVETGTRSSFTLAAGDRLYKYGGREYNMLLFHPYLVAKRGDSLVVLTVPDLNTVLEAPLPTFYFDAAMYLP